MTSSIFERASAAIKNALTVAEPVVRQPPTPQEPPVSLTRENFTEMKRSLPASVIQFKDNTVAVVPMTYHVALPTDVAEMPKICVSKDGSLPSDYAGRCRLRTTTSARCARSTPILAGTGPLRT